MLRRTFQTPSEVYYDYSLLTDLLNDLPAIFCVQDLESGKYIKGNNLFEISGIRQLIENEKLISMNDDEENVIALPDPAHPEETKIYRIRFKSIRQNEREIRLITGWDITAEYNQRSVDTENKTLHAFFNRCNAMVFMAGQNGKINFINDAFRRYTGKHQSIQFVDIEEYFGEDQVQRIKNLFEICQLKGESSGDVKILRKDGNWRWVTLQLSGKRDNENETDGVIGFLLDVDPEKNQRELNDASILSRTKNLEEENKILQRSNDDLEQFAYVASHDLQEPLRKISIFSDRLEKSLNNADENTLQYLAKIRGSAIRMTGLIHDLLNYSIVSRQNDAFPPVSLEAVIRTVINDYDLLISQKKATVDLKNLPVIEANTLMMNQLFYNLIGNSLKFSREDVAPEIKISSRKVMKKDLCGIKREMIKIMVQDNGIGFDQEYSEKIFNLFTRLDNQTKQRGSGIGLALCRKITDAHSGFISAQSEPGKTVFTVYLPVKQHS